MVQQANNRASLTSRTPMRDAETLLASLDALRAAITIFDSHGRLLYANAHFNYLLQAMPPYADLIGRHYEDIVRLEIAGGEIAPAALEQGEDAFIASRLLQLQPGEYAPLDIPLADQRVLEIKARHNGDGNIVLLWSDVTQARAQLARLNEAINLSADAFALFDARDRFVMGNELYAHLVNLDLGTLVGKPFAEIVTGFVRSGGLELDEDPDKWLARRLKGHREKAAAVTLRTASGKAYLVRDRATADGGRAMIFTDITDKVRAETALQEQQSVLQASRAKAEQQSSYLADLTQRLDQASARVASAKTTLLRTMGHELKTPLNAILGFSDLMATLSDNLNPAQIREYAGLVHQGGTNLLKIINQIMDLTKISAGRYELRRALVDAGGILWLARDVFAAKAQARHVTIDADACPLGLALDADESVLTAMMHSLVDNAVTFVPEGGKVTLSVAAQADDIIMVVQDNGAGVAPDDLARILEPFEHAGRNEAVEHSKGAGLGLTLVKAFAELHGGSLELDSRPGEGFRATVRLPRPTP